MDVSAEFRQNFKKCRITFPFQLKNKPHAEPYIISCNVIMEHNKYNLALNHPDCPENQNSCAFYMHMKMQGAELYTASDDEPVITKTDQKGIVVTSYGLAINDQKRLALCPLYPTSYHDSDNGADGMMSNFPTGLYLKCD